MKFFKGAAWQRTPEFVNRRGCMEKFSVVVVCYTTFVTRSRQLGGKTQHAPIAQQGLRKVSCSSTFCKGTETMLQNPLKCGQMLFKWSQSILILLKQHTHKWTFCRFARFWDTRGSDVKKITLLLSEYIPCATSLKCQIILNRLLKIQALK